jgi:hypothetical protein
MGLEDKDGSTTKEDPMFHPSTVSGDRLAILQWTARIGAVTAEALADHADTTLASARARLLAAERAQLLSRRHLLTGQPALYTVTPAGLRASGLRGLDPCRVSASNARHLIACARAAAALERCYPGQRVLGERELRREEREHGAELASARIGMGPDGATVLHRPDLALLPDHPEEGLPVAVEVELSVKTPRRLAAICRAWARCRCVAGVLYLVAPQVRSALERAVAEAQAGERIVVVALDALPPTASLSKQPTKRAVPGAA